MAELTLFNSARTRKPRLAVPLLLSDCDMDLAQFKWGKNKDGYLYRNEHIAWINGKKHYRTVYLHRVILSRIEGRPVSRHEIADHINRIRIDNRRENIRLTTAAGNSQNKGLAKANTSGFRGVTRHKQTGKWQAAVGFRGKCYFCGLFDSPNEAAVAAAAKRRELNFLGEPSTN